MKLVGENYLGDRELPSRVEKEEEERQRRETLTQVDIETRNREDYRRKVRENFCQKWRKLSYLRDSSTTFTVHKRTMKEMTVSS